MEHLLNSLPLQHAVTVHCRHPKTTDYQEDGLTLVILGEHNKLSQGAYLDLEFRVQTQHKRQT